MDYFLFSSTYLFFVILLLFIVWALFLYFLKSSAALKYYSLWFSILLSFCCLILWVLKPSFEYAYVMFYLPWSSNFGINYIIFIDDLSILFLFLSIFIIPFCILSAWTSLNLMIKEFLILLLFLEFLLFHVFSINDILLFYIFFESTLIPIYFIIGIWGTRFRKIHAANLLFLYTYIGSVFFLVSILYLLFIFKTTSWFFLLKYCSLLSVNSQYFLWLCFFISFCVKIPMFPVHLWLPEAHVEAPTSGSVLLAAVLLKLGSYAMLRFLLPFFPVATFFFKPFVFLLAFLSIILSSLICLRQNDLKKIIAYSSISHMNLLILGLFSENIISIVGSSFMMLSHGISSSALFLLIGFLYDRFHTRLIKYYQGLVHFFPLFCLFFLFFSFANISFPLTSGFVGEILIFVGLFKNYPVICFFSCISIIFGAVFSIWLYNRIAYGFPLKKFFIFCDLTRKEFFILSCFVFLSLFLGIFPKFFLDVLELNLNILFF